MCKKYIMENIMGAHMGDAKEWEKCILKYKIWKRVGCRRALASAKQKNEQMETSGRVWNGGEQNKQKKGKSTLARARRERKKEAHLLFEAGLLRYNSRRKIATQVEDLWNPTFVL